MDSLTGLTDRRGAEEWLVRHVSDPGLRGQPLSLALIDIDDMSWINRALGYEGGDALLRRFAQLLRGAVGPDDLLARWGGEEFALGWPGGDADEAAVEMDVVRRRFNELQFEHLGIQSRGFAFSTGVAEIVVHQGPAFDGLSNRLIDDADRALSLAKEDGGNSVRVF